LRWFVVVVDGRPWSRKQVAFFALAKPARHSRSSSAESSLSAEADGDGARSSLPAQ